VVTNEKISLPKCSLCVFSNNKYTWLTEITFMVNMENIDDWLASNNTWKKWTRIGDGELLSDAGINFQKPIDEERLVKEIKRRKKLNYMKLLMLIDMLVLIDMLMLIDMLVLQTVMISGISKCIN
jgi:hypothetical protein